MTRIAVLLTTAAVVLAGVAVPAAVAAPVPAADGAPGEDAVRSQVETDGPEPSNETAAPGARLAGVVAVQGAEVEGELAGRSFGIAVARANSNASKASVVADQVSDLEGRLEALRERRRALETARENGTISEARYRAETTALSARTAAVEGQLERTESASSTLPDEALAERGVERGEIRALRTEARNLSGPGVAQIAREMAGPNPGRSLAAGGNASAERRPPGLQGSNGPTNRTDRPTPTGSAGPSTTGIPGVGGGPASPAANETGGGPPVDLPGGGPPGEATTENDVSIDRTPGGGPPSNRSRGAGKGGSP